jgi:hypothetical protein
MNNTDKYRKITARRTPSEPTPPPEDIVSLEMPKSVADDLRKLMGKSCVASWAAFLCEEVGSPRVVAAEELGASIYYRLSAVL